MKQLTVGDKNLATKFINSYFGIYGETFTKETEKRVKQFQQSFQQIYRNNPNIPYVADEVIDKYTQLYADNDELKVAIRQILPVLWPNGIVDIFTMNAIMDTEIDYYDYDKVKQCKQALNGTEYSDFGNIFEMLCEMAKNLNFRLDNNLDFVPTIVKKEIKRIVGADETVYGGSDQKFERDDLVDYHLAEFTIYGKNEYTGTPHKDKLGYIIDIGDISSSNPYLKALWVYGKNSSQPDGSQTTTSPQYVYPIQPSVISRVDLNNIGNIKLQEIVDRLGSDQVINYSIDDNVCNIQIENGHSITLPTVGDYIDVEDRQPYTTILSDGMYLRRIINIDTPNSYVTEYMVWMDRYYTINTITSIKTTDGDGVKFDFIKPPNSNCNKLLYLIEPSDGATVEISQLGLYQHLDNLVEECPEELYELFGVNDKYDAVSQKIIKRINKVVINGSFVDSSNWSKITYNGKNAVRFDISISNIDINHIICSHYTFDDTKDSYIAIDENYLYIIDDSFTSLSKFKSIIKGWESNSTPLTLWYKQKLDTYLNMDSETFDVISLQGYRYLISESLLNAQYEMDPRFETDEDVLCGPNPLYPGIIEGVGSSDTLEIHSENKDKSKCDTTIIPISSPLYGFGEEGDYYDVTSGTIYRKCFRCILTGDEVVIDVSPYSNDKFTVFGIPNIMQDRSLVQPGMCNYFKPVDQVWLGKQRGFTFETSASQNIYFSIDNEIIGTSEHYSAGQKIECFRRWLRQCYNKDNPVTFYYLKNHYVEEPNLPIYEIPQYEDYTRIYNNYDAHMQIRLHVVIYLKKGEVTLCGLFDEGIIDLSERLPDTIMSYENGLYDRHTIEAIRLYQKTHDIGQDTEYGRYYSGVLNVPTYNAMKKEFGLTEEVGI